MQKNGYEIIKRTVSLRTAAECYGLPVNRSGMICCIFHADRNPSMKLYEDHFFCFGCHTHGDVIDFTAKLFSLKPNDAANKLCSDFGISVGNKANSQYTDAAIQIPYEKSKQYRNDEQNCYLSLVQYFKLLEYWEKKYAPTTSGTLDDRFVEACSTKEYVDYLCNIFISGSDEERVKTVRELLPRLPELKEHVSKHFKEEF